MGINARVRKDVLLQRGVSVGRTVADNCYANNYPNITAQSMAATQPRPADFCQLAPPRWSGNGSQVTLVAAIRCPGISR